MTPLLIGIAGPAGSGKTTAANILAWGRDMRLIGFADPVRVAVRDLFGQSDLKLLEVDKDRRLDMVCLPSEVRELLWFHVQRIEPYALAAYAARTGDPDCGVSVAVMNLLQVAEDDVLDNRRVKCAISPRHALRVFGDFGRGVDPALYLHAAGQALARDEGRPAVVHDVRLAAEAAWIRERGGTVLHMQCPGVKYSHAHATEYGPGYDPADLVVVNPGQLAPLRAELLHCLSLLEPRRAGARHA
jgi:hypothetical protein